MMICSKCRLEMKVIKTGRFVRFGPGHCYSGDEFACKGCGATVVNCPSQPFHNTTAEAVEVER